MKTGRPIKDIDLSELKELMAFYPSLDETAGWFDVSPDSVSRKLQNELGMTFAEFRKHYMAKTKIALKRIAIQKAMDGNEKMLIHCLRTLTDMDDREVVVQDLSSLSTEELIQRSEELISELK